MSTLLWSPGGDGIWPAFWMLPAASSNGSLPYGVWPRSGEIDVMESVNAFSQVFGTVHYGLPQQQLGAALSQSASTGVFAGAMHTYAVNWSQEQISWYCSAFPCCFCYSCPVDT